MVKSLTIDGALHELANQLLGNQSSSPRFLLGITGVPGAGKSTIAKQLLDKLNTQTKDSAVLVPMDGYHFSNEKLDSMGLLSLKGIPDTFDALGYVSLMESLKSEGDRVHFAPLFDRTVEASIDNAIEIRPSHRIIISEGNYLLLEASPWNRLKSVFDRIWFIDAGEDIIFPRLLQRHLDGGRSAEGALEKVTTTDLPNAKLVESTKNRADALLKIDCRS